MLSPRPTRPEAGRSGSAPGVRTGGGLLARGPAGGPRVCGPAGGPRLCGPAGGSDGSRGTGHPGTRIVAVTTTPRARTQ